jgi:predicted transcriptional regulator
MKVKFSVSLTPEENRKLRAMASTDERSRSTFVGRLIRQEWDRRQAQQEAG